MNVIKKRAPERRIASERRQRPSFQVNAIRRTAQLLEALIYESVTDPEDRAMAHEHIELVLFFAERDSERWKP